MRSRESELQSVSSWQGTAFANAVPGFPPLKGDTTADVCVIGGGIAGLTAAYLLAKEGKSVVLCESRQLAAGDTGRTTAHLTLMLDDRYFELAKIHGLERATLAAQSHAAAIDRIEQITKEENIDCDFARVEGCLVFSKSDDESLRRERDTLREMKVEHEALPQAPVKGFPQQYCLQFPRQAQFHPLLYMIGLAKAAEQLGMRICCNTPVSNIEEGDSCTVTTEHGVIRSQYVIVATHAPVRDNARVYSRQSAYRTFVLAARVPKGALPTVLLWDTHDPYHYVRLHSSSALGMTNEDDDLLIVGGEDHKTAQRNDAELRFARLERWMRAHFPMAEKVAYRWSGQVYEPDDGLALIGLLPGAHPHVLIATGFSGSGITYATIAGMLLTDIIFQRENPWAEVYDPARMRLGSVKEFVKENANVAKEAVAGWLPGGSGDADDVAPGSGTIIKRGTKRIALYRDDTGNVHECSAVCPHKQCIVAWNSFEKSWDCPCHGSRFAPLGAVLNGPAMTGLPPVSAKG